MDGEGAMIMFVLRGRTMNFLLALGAVVAAGIAIHYGLRFGDVYRVGDSEYRRTLFSDLTAIVIPAVVFLALVALLALRLLAGDGITAQWRRERELLKAAEEWDGRDPWS